LKPGKKGSNVNLNFVSFLKKEANSTFSLSAYDVFCHSELVVESVSRLLSLHYSMEALGIPLSEKNKV